MKNLFASLLLGFGLLVGRPALAQFYPGLYPAYRHHRCCHCCCHRDTTTTTERTNRIAWLLGPSLLVTRTGRAYGGGTTEAGVAVGPRLTVGGQAMMSLRRASDTNFGTQATAPAYSLNALTGRARYQLLNRRRWRVETLAGLGLGAVWLVDQDQQVYYPNRYGGSDSRPATVAFRVYPVAEVGLGGSWKVNREFWLTTQASYTQQALRSGLGEPAGFSYWSATVAATVPWGYPSR